MEYYKIPDDIRRYRTIKPYYVLIYGRRSEFEDDIVLSQKRGQLARQDEVLMTYDRLIPNKDTFELMTVRITERGYTAISVPPTMHIGPNLAETRAMISNKYEAIAQNTYITKERKEFLLSRMNYWDDWGRSGKKGIISTGDKE